MALVITAVLWVLDQTIILIWTEMSQQLLLKLQWNLTKAFMSWSEWNWTDLSYFHHQVNAYISSSLGYDQKSAKETAGNKCYHVKELF